MLLIVCRFIVVNGFTLLAMDSLKLRTSLGTVVRARRTQLGYSQESFADKVGVHRTYMGALERGERNVSLTNLVRLAAALGRPLSELIAEAEKALKNSAGRK
jgi:transcriptional regulator with XRE-family HTH domain